MRLHCSCGGWGSKDTLFPSVGGMLTHALRLLLGRRMSSYSMQEEPNFQFGDDRGQRYQRDERDMYHQQPNHYMHPNRPLHQQQQQQQQSYQQFPPHQQQGEHAVQPKYNSANARSSGNPITRPGASIMNNNEETALLKQVRAKALQPYTKRIE